MKYKVWWLQKDRNFGDILTPYILDFFNISYEHSSIDEAQIICIGSIARHARDGQLVLGSGIINGRKEKLNPNAIYKFVRGPYTRQKVLDRNGVCPEIYGDPAMLLPLVCPEEEKEFSVGIVPHFVDYNYVKEKYPNYKIINVVNDNPLEVAREISKCRTIISSSLHGIIAAHAYGIPAAWVKFSNNVKGDDVKFRDHYASLGLSATLSTVEDPIYSVGKINLNPIINIFTELAR